MHVIDSLSPGLKHPLAPLSRPPSARGSRRSRSAILPLALACVGLSFLEPGPAQGELPLPTYPNCGTDPALAECPPDLLNSDGSYRSDTWEFLSFIPPGMEAQVRPEEVALGSGNGLDVAWRYSTGRFDVTIAVLDSGIRWRDGDVANKVALNSGELPSPQRADGTACSGDDCNGDGIFNVQDFAADPRVSWAAGQDTADDRIDGSDLIAVFSDGVDDDDNGYIDDIAGWDFLWDDNDPWTNVDFSHGTEVMEQAAAEGGETATKIGVCPNCSVLPIRTGDSFIADADRLANGIVFAVDSGADVIAMASGTINYTPFLVESLRYAYENGVFVTVAIGDELSYHHLYPGAADYTFAVHSIFFWPPTDWDKAKSFLGYNGCNNYGSHLTIVAGTNACATGSTAITAGAAGLLISRGREMGLSLHPDDIRSLLQSTATDINVRGSGTRRSPYFPSDQGWDLFFGYGRINVGKALESLELGIAPPGVQIHSPGWYKLEEGGIVTVEARVGLPPGQSTGLVDWKLSWAPGGDPLDSAFVNISNGVVTTPDATISVPFNLDAIPLDRFDPEAQLEQVMADMSVEEKFAAVNRHAITLKLTADGPRGEQSEHRKVFFFQRDPDMAPGFPLQVGASGEASPFLVDLDGDGVLDIVLGTAKGEIVAVRGDGTALPGWPKQMPLARGVELGAEGSHHGADSFTLGGVERPREGVLGGVVVGDLEGDGELEVVAVTMDGLLYVYSKLGVLRPGFPVSRNPVGEADTGALNWYDPGIMSTPLLVDLDADGTLEVVVSAMDQTLYVWNSDGDPQPGFPVRLEHEGSSAHVKGRSISSPAAADLDGDGQLDIVVGTNEWDPEQLVPGYAYGVSGLGTLDPRGPNLPGWPATVLGALNGLIPWIGEGVAATPAVGDVDGDGDPEVVLSSIVSCLHLYNGEGRREVTYPCSGTSWGRGSPTQERGALAFVSTPLMVDVDQDGDLEVIAAMSGLDFGLALLGSTWVEYQDHLIVIWDAATGEPQRGWPQVIEDVGFFMRPAVADIDGDGALEILASTGGQTVHAYGLSGVDSAGWPKFTGGWVVNAIAVGDVTGDGQNDVIVNTREGYLFVWQGQGTLLAPQQGSPWTGWTQ